MSAPASNLRGITRQQAVRELADCQASLYECEQRYKRETPSGRWCPPTYIADEIMSDVGAYCDRIRELEAFLGQPS